MEDQSHTQIATFTSRRQFLVQAGVAVLAAAAAPAAAIAGNPPPGPTDGTTIMDFERKLKRMRFEHYRHPPVDILKEGFRPVGGKIADFATARQGGRDHFFYIERRLQEGTPFYPGHEIYFGHASTADFFAWEVHDPVMLVRPGTWEEAHVWAPCILAEKAQFIMAYTGLNRHLSQDIGLASSRDLFEWKRWPGNPLSPCRNAPWAAWWDDDIASCRDPHLLRHDGRVWMVYTANTREGAACLALASSRDFKRWKDHGPIITGPTAGYEPSLTGGHLQGSFESANLSFREGRWLLLTKAPIRNAAVRTWAAVSERPDKFDLEQMWPFWKDAIGVEVVRNQGTRSLVAGMVGGYLRFAEVDWAETRPSAREIKDRETLRGWNPV